MNDAHQKIIDILNILKHDKDHEVSTDVCHLLERFSKLECAGPRDKVYSLVSLDPDFGLKADYTLSIIELCISLSRILVERRDSHVLVRNTAMDAHNFEASLPSWVIDLRSKDPYGPAYRGIMTATINNDLEMLLEAY